MSFNDFENYVFVIPNLVSNNVFIVFEFDIIFRTNPNYYELIKRPLSLCKIRTKVKVSLLGISVNI